MQSTNNPSMQGLGNTPTFLVEGTWVVGFFLDAVEKQQPLIMGTLPGVPQAVADTTKGFNDPNGTYPSEKITHSNHAIQESDVNRLARNDTEKEHAVVSAKNTGRTTGVAIANSSTTKYLSMMTWKQVYKNLHLNTTANLTAYPKIQRTTF